MTTPEQLAETYFESWKHQDFNRLRAILSDDCHFAGPLAVIDNADDCVAGLGAMSRIVTDIVVVKRLSDGEDVITWFDLHTSIAPPAATANWSHAEDGKITAIRVTFDPREIVAAG